MSCLTGVTNRSDSAILDAYRYDYDAANMITAITRNQQKMSFAYDKTWQLTAEQGTYLSFERQTSNVECHSSFTYDPAGNRVANFEAGAAPRVWLHTPDNQLTAIVCNVNTLTLRGRIENAWTALYVRVKQRGTTFQPVTASLTTQPGQPVRWEARDVPVTGTGTIQFDIECVTPDNQTSTYTASYTRPSSPSAQPSVLYAYDANGNRVKMTFDIGHSTFDTWYTYDDDNQLIGINGYTDEGTHYTRTYTYDAFGRRISATEDGVTRHFVFDGLDVIAELNASAQVTKWYVRGSGLGGGIGDVIAISDQASGIRYPSYNHRGDVVSVTDANGAVVERSEYTAFGQPLSGIRYPASGIRRVAFSSKEYDTTSGLSYYGFRYYDPHSARWMNKDPLLWEDGVNLYRFVACNPARRLDYLGLEWYDNSSIVNNYTCSFNPPVKMRMAKEQCCRYTEEQLVMPTVPMESHLFFIHPAIYFPNSGEGYQFGPDNIEGYASVGIGMYVGRVAGGAIGTIGGPAGVVAGQYIGAAIGAHGPGAVKPFEPNTPLFRKAGTQKVSVCVYERIKELRGSMFDWKTYNGAMANCVWWYLAIIAHAKDDCRFCVDYGWYKK